VSTAVYASLQPREYYFLKGYTTPYRKEDVNIHSSASTTVEFLYNADTRVFSDMTPYTTTKYLPILSLDLIRDTEVYYDLTDFVERMTVVSNAKEFKYPSVSQIMSAWTIDSKVLFDPSIDFFARIVSEEGATYEFVLSDTTDISYGIKAADAQAEADEKAAADAKAVADAKDVNNAKVNVVTELVTAIVADTLAEAMAGAMDKIVDGAQAT
jgi:hypothetical protein